MRDKLRVGIAGYGLVGERRRIYIDKHPSFQTVAISDIKFEDSIKVSNGLKVFNNYYDLLKEDLDVLFVSLPNKYSAEASILGLQKGLHVFCEKPPSRTVEELEEVINVERHSSNKILKYGFNHRYHESVKDAKKLIESGELGDVIDFRGVYGKSRVVPFSGGWRAKRSEAGGGILLDQGIHMVDLIRYFGGEFNEVKSFISNNYWKHDVEDNVYAILKSDSGKFAVLHSSATQWEHKFCLNITLSQGFIELSGLLTSSKSYGEEKLTIGRREENNVGTLKKEEIKYLEDNTWGDEIEEFADAIVNGRKIKYGNSTDALKTMQLVYGIYKADAEWANRFNI